MAIYEYIPLYMYVPTTIDIYMLILLSIPIDIAEICRSLSHLYARVFAYSKYVYKYFVVYGNIDNYRYKYMLLLIVMNILINKAYLLSFIASSIFLAAYRYVSIYIHATTIDIHSFYWWYKLMFRFIWHTYIISSIYLSAYRYISIYPHAPID